MDKSEATTLLPKAQRQAAIKLLEDADSIKVKTQAAMKSGDFDLTFIFLFSGYSFIICQRCIGRDRELYSRSIISECV